MRTPLADNWLQGASPILIRALIILPARAIVIPEVGLDGLVYAADIDKKLLAYIKNRAQEKQMTNIRTVFYKDGLKIPEQGCDLIFLRNVFHHLHEREAYFKELKRFLKPEGRVAIIDYKKHRTLSFIALMGHYVDECIIREVMNNAGYDQVKSYDFLPEQNFSVYRMASELIE